MYARYINWCWSHIRYFQVDVPGRLLSAQPCWILLCHWWSGGRRRPPGLSGRRPGREPLGSSGQSLIFHPILLRTVVWHHQQRTHQRGSDRRQNSLQLWERNIRLPLQRSAIEKLNLKSIQSVMNDEFSLQRFWLCHKEGLIKTISTTASIYLWFTLLCDLFPR